MGGSSFGHVTDGTPGGNANNGGNGDGSDGSGSDGMTTGGGQGGTSSSLGHDGNGNPVDSASGRYHNTSRAQGSGHFQASLPFYSDPRNSMAPVIVDRSSGDKQGGQRMVSSYNVGGGQLPNNHDGNGNHGQLHGTTHGGGHDHASGVRAWPHDMAPVLVPDPSMLRPKSPLHPRTRSTTHPARGGDASVSILPTGPSFGPDRPLLLPPSLPPFMPLSQINRRGGHIQVSPPSFFRLPPSNELLLHGTQLWVGKDENGSLVVEVWPADRVQQLEAKRAAEQAHARSLAEQKRRQGGGRPIIGDGLPPDLTNAHHQRNISYGEARIEAVSFLKPKKPESKLVLRYYINLFPFVHSLLLAHLITRSACHWDLDGILVVQYHHRIKYVHYYGS
jgi:hypothetical protein